MAAKAADIELLAEHKKARVVVARDKDRHFPMCDLNVI
jgi:hypothetical protein